MTGARSKRLVLAFYLAALAASHLHLLRSGPRPVAPPGRIHVEVAAFSDSGPVPGRRTRISVLRWDVDAARRDRSRTPVLLLHGSPGSARDLGDLGTALAGAGWTTLAADLPGFGFSAGSAPSYSIRAHARAALATLDDLGIERVHVVGWSMGGGVALQMADLAAPRIASVSLVASVGVQEAEGSGSFHFEHFKYAVGYIALVVVPELVPHFGWLGSREHRRGFIRNFWDTDQRPLRGLMQRLATPTLILHGNDDFLVPAWAASVSHELIGPSRLVLFDAGHFLPLGGRIGQLDAMLPHLKGFLSRHDPRDVEPERFALDLTPRPAGRPALEPFTIARRIPWWLLFPGLAVAAALAPLGACLAVGLLIAATQIDAGAAVLACGLGRGTAAAFPASEGRRAGRVTRAALIAAAAVLIGSLAEA